MPNIKISQMPNLANVTATTQLPVVDAGQNFSITAANLQTFINGSANGISATGNITGGNIIAISNVIGNGSRLSSITGANVVGAVANATFATSAGTATSATTAGTVTTAAQPNITSVGTLTSLTVSGNITGGNISTAGRVSANTFVATANANANLMFATTEVLIGPTSSQGGVGLTTTGNAIINGNITSNGNLSVQTSNGVSFVRAWPSTGNLQASGNITGGNATVTGNVTATNFIGSGTFLTGLSGNLSGGNLGANLVTNAFYINGTAGAGGQVLFGDPIRVSGGTSIFEEGILSNSTIQLSCNAPGEQIGLTASIDGNTTSNVTAMGATINNCGLGSIALRLTAIGNTTILRAQGGGTDSRPFLMNVANVQVAASGTRTLDGYLAIYVDGNLRYLPYYL